MCAWLYACLPEVACQKSPGQSRLSMLMRGTCVIGSAVCVCVHTALRPADEDEADDEEAVKGKDDISDDDAEEAPKTPKEKKFETVVDWELLNGNKALWLRDTKDVEPEEYENFFSALSKVCAQPVSRAVCAAHNLAYRIRSPEPLDEDRRCLHCLV